LEKLQSAPESVKTRWMVISAAVIMVIVIYVWLAYFNNLMAGFSKPLAQTSAQTQVEQQSAADSGGVTMWSSFKDGMASLYQVFVGELHFLGSILQAPREYIVKPPR